MRLVSLRRKEGLEEAAVAEIAGRLPILHSGPSADGSGATPSVTIDVALRIRAYLAKKFRTSDGEPIRLLDFGAGLGNLQVFLDSDPAFRACSVEGSADLLPKIVCRPDRFIVADLCNGPPDPRLAGAFHLVTAFEALEHLRPQDVPSALSAAASLGDHLLATIHVANEENAYHKTIRPFAWWAERLREAGATSVESLGSCPIGSGPSEEFREETGLWDWQCSIAILASFVEADT